MINTAYPLLQCQTPVCQLVRAFNQNLEDSGSFLAGSECYFLPSSNSANKALSIYIGQIIGWFYTKTYIHFQHNAFEPMYASYNYRVPTIRSSVGTLELNGVHT